MRLDEKGRGWLSLGGELRSRLEIWEDFDFGAPADADDVFLLARALVHAELRAGERVRLFVQGKTAVSTDRDLPGGKRPSDVDSLALQNAFLEVELVPPAQASVRLRIGREELRLGAQRLVSPSGWTNTRRTFDGVSLLASRGGWSGRALLVRPVRVRQYRANDHTANDSLHGVYIEGPLWRELLRTDLYWLARWRDGVAVNGTSGAERRHTVGTRLFGALPGTPVDYEVEGALQRGSLGGEDLSAGFVASELGLWLAENRFSPRWRVGFDYASGDETPGGDVETFDPLFPLGHRYLGAVDVVGRQNVAALSTGLSFRPRAAVTADLSLHRFWRAETRDALYSKTGAVSRPGLAGDSRQVGTEVDAVLRWQLAIHLAVSGGYGHFFPARFIEQSGADSGIDFGYAQVEYVF